MEHPSRLPIALAASLALHSAVLGLMRGRGVVQLELLPAPILLTLLDAGNRTAGPGERSPRLQVAAPAPAQAASASLRAETETKAAVSPKPKAVRPQPVAAPAKSPEGHDRADAAEPEAIARAASVPPRTGSPNSRQPDAVPSRKAATAPSRTSRAPGEVHPANNGDTAIASLPSSAPFAEEGGTGADGRSAAPAWAPTARVQYEQLLFSWIDRHKQYPMLARRRGLEGIGSLRVRIARDGRVLERSLDSSTGESMLDDAALDMVRRASPFPKVPAGYAGTSFEFVAPIEYRLR